MSAESPYKLLPCSHKPDAMFCGQPVTDIGEIPFLTTSICPPEGANRTRSASDGAEYWEGRPPTGAPDQAVYEWYFNLVHLIRSGNKSGLVELYALLNRGVRFYLARRVRPVDVDDLVNETFVLVVQAIQRNGIREPARLIGFIHTVAARQALRQGRANDRARQEESAGDLLWSLPDSRGDPEARCRMQQRYGLLRKALNQLEERDQQILMRFYLLEQTKEEVCHALGLTETQFRLRKWRALARLRNAAGSANDAATKNQVRRMPALIHRPV
jgi:RNA polymerase sigma-70 factor, ECF subfamily